MERGMSTISVLKDVDERRAKEQSLLLSSAVLNNLKY